MVTDVSNRVFTNVREYVRSVHPNTNCQNAMTVSPDELPALGFRQINMREVGVDLDQGTFDDHVAVECSVEIQVFSNSDLTEARDIMNTACDAMRAMTVTRNYGAALIEDRNNRGIWRMVARFSRIVHGLSDIPRFDVPSGTGTN